MEKTITFDSLPEAVGRLGEEIREIKSMLVQRVEPQPAPPQDEILTTEEAAAFLRLSVATIYTKVSRGELTAMKQGNRLYFSKFELMDYLRAGKKKSNAEIQAEAGEYISKDMKGGVL